MIHRISSSLPSFKSISFRGGLNLVLADKSSGATDRQTRNSSGKSSLVEIIHFLLGADCKPDSIFRSITLEKYDFTLDFELRQHRLSASRAGKSPSRITVDSSSSDWPQQPKLERITGETHLTNDNWKSVLASQMFGLTQDEEKYGPGFRSLLSYFIRRDNSGGFQTAGLHSTKPHCAKKQTAEFSAI
jgi:uncharacterized protein YydD (DUF2326 family)